MKTIILFVFTLVPLFSFASGGGGGSYGGGSYGSKRSTPSTYQSPRKNKPSTSYASYRRVSKPQALSKKDLRNRIDKLKKGKGISINYLNLDGKNFILKGSFQDRSSFAQFIRELRGERKERDRIKLHTEDSQSSRNSASNFTIKGLNRWQ